MPGLVPDITFFVPVVGVDGRVKPGHDVERTIARKNSKHPARRKRLADVLHLGLVRDHVEHDRDENKWDRGLAWFHSKIDNCSGGRASRKTQMTKALGMSAAITNLSPTR